MPGTPRVSVIVPAYNTERTIAEAVESVLAQSTRDLECLVIDDGSMDQTRRVLESLQAADPDRVRILSHPHNANQGVAAARNLGLEQARGEFLAFLDADDAWLPEKLERQLEMFKREPELGFVFSDALVSQRPDSSRRMSEQELLPYPQSTELTRVFGSTRNVAEGLLFEPAGFLQNWIPSPTPVIRRSLIDPALRFVGSPRLSVQYEDFLFWLSASISCRSAYLSEPTAIYRVHADQYTERFRRTLGHFDHVRGLHQVMSLFIESSSAAIEQRKWSERIRSRMEAELVAAVTQIQRRQFAELWQMAGRWGCRGRVLSAWMRLGRQSVESRVRKTWVFQRIRPLLKSMRSAGSVRN